MDEILDNYEVFIMVFGVLLILAYLIYSTILKRKSKNMKSLEEENFYALSNKSEEVTTFSKEDQERFEEMVAVLPLEKGSLSFIMNHNMEKIFHSSQLDDLYTFYYDCSGVENCFLNTQVEAKREYLHNLVGEYIELISKNSNSLERSQLKVVKGLPVIEAKAKQIVKSYKALIETVENKLSSPSL